MFKLLTFMILCVLVLPAAVFGRTCDDLGRGQAYQPMDFNGSTVCFVFTKTPTEEGQLSRDPDGIAIYSLSKSEKSRLVYEFPYAGTKGKINDAFAIFVSAASEEMFFVIHSVEAPRAWDVISDVYDVSVFVFEGGALVRDELRSGFFDMGGDMKDNVGELSYVYPYKDKISVSKAVRSILFEVAGMPVPISGVVKEKSFLYGSDTEPVIQEPSRVYLIKGDEVAVEQSMAGWCKVSFVTKVKRVQKWMQCKSIAFSERQ